MSNPYSSSDQQRVTISQDRTQRVRGMQIITIGLMMGTLSFLTVALVINQAAIDGEPDILAWMGLGFAGLIFLVHLVVPGIVTSAALNQVNSEALRKADDDGRFAMLSPVYQTRLIIACAMLEGAAFFNLVAYIVDKYVGNVIAAVVLIIMIAVRFPTLSKVEFWVQDRAREIEMR
ncbi:MAG: hypothetical protein R3C59_25085 [Planctomycetaceae bacterium]